MHTLIENPRASMRGEVERLRLDTAVGEVGGDSGTAATTRSCPAGAIRCDLFTPASRAERYGTYSRLRCEQG